ncbi:hypothetical protein AZE42_08949, partial [Rhizopogon vesiculosus]
EIDDSLEGEAACATAGRKRLEVVQICTTHPAIPPCSFPGDIDHSSEHKATRAASEAKSDVVLLRATYGSQDPTIPWTSDYHDIDELFSPLTDSNEPVAPFTQVPSEAPAHTRVAPSYPLKRKASDISEVPDSENEDYESSVEIVDDVMMNPAEDSLTLEVSQPNTVIVKQESAVPRHADMKQKKSLRTTSLTSVAIASTGGKAPPCKRVKVEPTAIPATRHQEKMDTTPDRLKSRGNYRNTDLPAAVQADQRWAKRFLPTVMLWAGNYEDVWSIPDDVLHFHVQLTFDAVYPELAITAVHGGVLHSLVRLSFYI